MRQVLAGLDRDARDSLAGAAYRLRTAERAIRDAGSDPRKLMTGGAEMAEYRHFPAGDLYDPDTHAQAYCHAHRPGAPAHVHLFLRPRGMPPGIEPTVPVAGERDAPCHLVAVGLGRDGWAERLFTTNRWVTGEAWYAAPHVAALLPCFRLDVPGAMAPVGEWLTALVAAFHPLIVRLAEERDRKVAQWSRAHPDLDPLEDEGLEITSRVAVDVEDWLRALGA